MAVSNSDPLLFSCGNKSFDVVAWIVVHWGDLLARVVYGESVGEKFEV